LSLNLHGLIVLLPSFFILAWITHLASVVPTCKELPMVHVTLLSIDQHSMWSFLAPSREVSNDESEVSSQHQGAGTSLFVDISTTTYMVFSDRSRPTTSTSLCSLEYGSQTYIPDPDSDAGTTSVDCGILPLATTTLISVPAEGSYDTISMTHLHLFYHIKAEDAEMDAEKEAETPKEIARNYHALSLLNKMRTGRGDLPWHISAVSAMSSALGRWEVTND
jgi:mediator of RNA polymerase II transcription subunit 13, fungi type